MSQSLNFEKCLKDKTIEGVSNLKYQRFLKDKTIQVSQYLNYERCLKGSGRQCMVVECSIVEKFLGIVWELWDVFTVQICSARAQIQSLKSS